MSKDTKLQKTEMFDKNFFLYTCIYDLYQKHNHNFENLILIFPNKRPIVFAKKHMSTIIQTPCFSPKFTTIYDFFLSHQNYTIPNEIILLWELYSIYIKKTGSKEKFEEFYYWGQMLLQDFDDIDKYLIQAHDLFSNLQSIKDFSDDFSYLSEEQKTVISRFWNISNSISDSSIKQNFIQIWNVLYDIYTEFNSVLSQKNIAYEGKAIRSVVSENTNWDTNKTYVFIGFNALNACEHKLFCTLQNLQCAKFYWDYDSYYLSKSAEAGYFISKNLSLYPNELDSSFFNSFVKPKQITILETPNSIAQVKQCENIIHAHSEQTNQAIVLADEQILIPLLNSIPDDIPYNISLGYPIKQTNAFDLILLFCSLHSNSQNNSFYYKDLIQLSANTVLQKVYPNECRELNEKMLNYSSFYYSQSSCKSNFNIPYVFENYTNPIHFCTALCEFISLIIKNPKNSDIDISILYAVYKEVSCIEDILQTNLIQIDTIQFITSIIKKTVTNKSIAIHGEPLQGIQIMGILETRLLDFETVTILSMQEDILPKKTAGSSFIPYSIRIGFGMPTIKEQNAMFAYYFYRLIQRAENINLLYSTQSDDSSSSEKSRYILQLLYESPFSKSITTKQISYPLKPEKTHQLIAHKTKDTLAFIERLRNGSEKLTPTTFYTFINCELQFYFSKIRRLSAPQPITEIPDDRDYGNIFHKTMEKIYTPYKNIVLTKNHIESILNDTHFISTTIQEAIKSELPHIEEITTTNTVYKAIERYVKNLLEFDINRTPFTIIEIEKKVDYTLQTPHANIHIGGIIDRIDLANGRYRITDYKTGSTKNKINSIESLFTGKLQKDRNSAAFQILLYGYIESLIQENQDIELNLLFLRDLHVTNNTFIFNNQTNENIYKYSEIHDEFKSLLHSSIQRFLDVSEPFTQTEKEHMCKYCDFIDFCKKSSIQD